MSTAIARSSIRSAASRPDLAAGKMLCYDLLRDVPVAREPFEYFIVPRFIYGQYLDNIQRDFPQIAEGGSFPLSSLSYGPAFERLTAELLGDEMRHLLSEKFSLDLEGRPTTLTVRGRTRLKDGQIHTDSQTKLITVLLYLNRDWHASGGRLRLLRGPHDLEATIAEVPPEEGALLAFRCRANAWHGHHPFEGQRRSLQLNYVVSSAASRWSSMRHSLSAWFKSFRG